MLVIISVADGKASQNIYTTHLVKSEIQCRYDINLVYVSPDSEPIRYFW